MKISYSAAFILCLIAVAPLFAAEVKTASPLPSPAPASLEVEVLSTLEKPIPEAEVSFFNLSGPSLSSPRHRLEAIKGEAGADGIFRQSLNPGSYRIEARATGWQSEVIKKTDLPAGESKTLKIKLQPGYVIAGKVFDEKNRPLAGAKVHYRASGSYSSYLFSESRDTETDNNGSFRLSHLKEGIYTLEVSFPGHLDRTLRDVGTGTEDCRVVLKDGYTIKGKIQGDVTGLKPTVTLEVKKEKWGSSREQVKLDAENNFVISNLKKGTHDLRLKDGDFVSDWARNIPAESSERALPITLTAYKGGSISGEVSSSKTGLPLENVQLRLSSAASMISGYERSDAQGNYTLRNVPAGDYELKVSLSYDSYSEPREEKKISLSPGQELTGIDFKIDPGREVSFRGLVVDSADKPVPDARIKLYCRPSSKKRFRADYLKDIHSDSSGAFAFSAFMNEVAEVKLSTSQDGFSPTESEAISLAPDQSSVDGIILKLSSGTSLRVEVVRGEDKSAPLAKVVLKQDRAGQKSATYFRTQKKLTDVRGVCFFKHLAPGSYRLEAAQRGFGTEERKFKILLGEAEKSIRVALKEGRDLRVAVRNAAGAPVAGAKVSAISDKGGFRSYYVSRDEEHETDFRGVCEIEDLPGKPLLVRVEAEGYEPVRRHRVAAERDEVEVILKEGGTITGRLLDSEGKPVIKMHVSPNLKKKDPFDFNFNFRGGRRTINLGQGYFKIKNLKVGDYDLEIKCPGFALNEVRDIEVKGGQETDVGEIKLAAEGVISGRTVRADNGEPIRKARVRVENLGIRASFFSSTGKKPGQFLLKNIPPGTYTILVSARDFKDKKVSGITISTGEKKELPPVELEKMSPAEIEEKQRERGFIPSLGIRIGKSEDPGHFIGLPVGEVEPGSAAAEAGLIAGETIVRVNGKTFFDNPGSFLKGIMGMPGTTVKLTVKQKDSEKEREVSLTIGEWDYEKLYRMMNK